MPTQREAFARSIGTPVEATHLLKFGCSGYGPTLEIRFPESDGLGRPRSISIRDLHGNKRQVPGYGGRGLVLYEGWRDRSAEVLQIGYLLVVAEGMTDGLCLSSAGFSCVARANAEHGADELSVLLADWPTDGRIVLLADHDESGTGLAGARKVAARVAAAVKRTVYIALPPDGAKDAREWLTAERWGDTAWPDRGRALWQHIEATMEAIHPPADPPEGADEIDLVADGCPPQTPPTDGPIGGSNDHTASPGRMRIVLIPGEETREQNQCLDAIARDPLVFLNGNTLSLLVQDGVGRPSLKPMNKETIRLVLDGQAELCEWKGTVKTELVAVYIPKRIVDGLFGRMDDFRSIRAIRRVVTHPLFLGDGTVLVEPGYPRATQRMKVGR